MRQALTTCECGQDSFFRDPNTLKEFCLTCSLSPKTSSDLVYLQLLDSALPFIVGDKVECYQAGDPERYVGVGTIKEISEDWRDGGTPLYPIFRVEMDDSEERWFTAICLKRSH